MRNYSFISLKLNFQRLGTIGFLPMKPKFLYGDLLQRADTSCLVMIRKESSDKLLLTVAQPDLALYRGPSDEAFDEDVREFLLKSGGNGYIITGIQMIDPYLTFATVVVPIIMSRLIRYCQLENRCFRRVSGIGIFNIGAQANNHSIDEMKGFSSPARNSEKCITCHAFLL